MYKSLILPLCCAPLSRARTWLARPTFTAQGSQTWIKNYDLNKYLPLPNLEICYTSITVDAVECLPYLAYNRLSGYLCNIHFRLTSLSRGIWILTNTRDKVNVRTPQPLSLSIQVPHYHSLQQRRDPGKRKTRDELRNDGVEEYGKNFGFEKQQIPRLY